MPKCGRKTKPCGKICISKSTKQCHTAVRLCNRSYTSSKCADRNVVHGDYGYQRCVRGISQTSKQNHRHRRRSQRHRSSRRRRVAMLRRSQHTLIRVPRPSPMFDSIFCSRGLGFLWFCRYTYTFLVIHLCSQTTTTVIWVLFLFCSPNVALIFKIYQRILKWGGGWDEQAIVQTGELFEDALLKLRVRMGDLYICPRCTPRPYPSDTKKKQRHDTGNDSATNNK